MSRVSVNSGYKFIWARCALAFMILLAYPVMTGAGLIDVALKNTDADNPLVDLSKVISAGGAFVLNDGEYISNESVQETSSDDADNQNDDPYTAVPHILKITGREIMLDGRSITALETLKSRLIYFVSNDIPISFDYEYAEIYTYLDVSALIEECGVNVVMTGSSADEE